MKNYDPDLGKELSVFITSDKNTSGTLSIPTTGYSENFTITANQTTQVDIDDLIAEHIASEIIEDKGILITTQDDVSVFAINFLQFTADGMKILPTPTLGTEYRVMAHQGYGDNLNDGSLFLIIATEDNTEIEIIPTQNTAGGRNANIPFTIVLDRGESYQVISSGDFEDFTGTTIKGVDNQSTCKPFAVFSGASCPYIPTNCLACDHITDQNIPVNTWGRKFHIVPWKLINSFTVKVLANEDNTTFTINGSASITLDAGQYYEQNSLTENTYISSNKVVAVAQFMEGAACSGGTGDPAMVILNADNQKIDNVTFSTVNSAIINNHYVYIVTKSDNTGNVTLDGNTVNIFELFDADSSFSFATVSINQGSHTLNSIGEFIAYAYGVGGFETYAYSVGANVQVTEIDLAFCTTDSIKLEAPDFYTNVWWSTSTNTKDTINVGSTYTAFPTTSISYFAHGINQNTNCEEQFAIQINVPPEVNAELDSCFYEPNIIYIDEERVNVNIEWYDANFDLILENENNITITEGGTYYLKTDFQGFCSYLDTIVVDKQEISIDVPNIFTPNNDGYNDKFRISERTCIQTFNLQLYNRWGKCIYQSNDPNFNWDGDDLNDGTYYYFIEINKDAESSKKVKGWVQILK